MLQTIKNYLFMIKSIFTLLIVTIITFISCKNETTRQKPNLDFIQTYEGTIAGKYPVHLKLISDNGNLSGNYFYDKVGTSIEVKGTLTTDSIFNLNEFDEKGNQTGLWKGRLINQNKINGTWSKPNGTSPFDFNLIVTSENYESSKNEIFDLKYSKYTGTYNSDFKKDGISVGELKINYIGNQKIDFSLIVATQDCIGDITGTAKIDLNGNAKYSGDGCESLTFNFKKGEVEIEENDCNHHGAYCVFNGTYKK